MLIEVYSDGSATTATKPGGWAFVIIIDGQFHSEGSGHMPLASNNDAELEAAIQGLKAAHALTTNPSVGSIATDGLAPELGPFVTLVADSQLVIGWVEGTYSFRQAQKFDKFKELQLYAKLTNTKTRWVQGHTGDVYNERCDFLAKEARLSRPQPPPAPPEPPAPTTNFDDLIPTNYIVAQIGLDAKGQWTVLYSGDVPEQGGIQFGRGSLTFLDLDSALLFMKRELGKQTETYKRLISQKVIQDTSK